MDRRKFILASATAGVGLTPGLRGLLRPGSQSDAGPASRWPDFIGGKSDGPIVPWSAYVPDGTGPFPGVIVIHGGHWVSGTRWDTQDQCRLLKTAGYTAMTLDYTLATLDNPGYPDAVDDVIRYMRWCQTQARFKLDRTSPIGLLGSSAGGTIAHEVGMRSGLKPTSIATMSGIQNLLASYPADEGLGVYIGCEPDVCNARWIRASPIESATPAQPPTLLINSTAEVVPVGDPQRYHDKLVDMGVYCDLKLYEGHLHGGALLRRCKADLVAFFDWTLKGISPPG